MSSEDEGVSHPPSYRLDSLTDFLHKTVDPVIVRSKPMVSFVGSKSVKNRPTCLRGNKNVVN